jgi:uncharacterized protein
MNAMPPRSFRNDGYMNLLSGLNTPGLDRTASTFPTSSLRGRGFNNWRMRRSLPEFADLYMTNGIAQKIIDRPADDSFQRGVEIENDDEEIMDNEFDRLQVLAKMADAVRWSRLFGGSALLLVAKDGGEFTDPLNLNALDTIQEIKVMDITCIRGTEKTYDDATDPTTYGKIEYYEIVAPGINTFQVHETRIIPVSGEPIPFGYVFYNRIPWMGRSILEACYNDISRYEQGLEWSLRLLERKQQAVYSMSGLAEMWAQGDDNMVKERINLVDLVRGNLNSVVVDKEDTYVIQSIGMEGVEQAIQEYQIAVAAAANMPVTILFGKPQKGLNQTGAGDLEAYYGMVSHIQNTIARPPMEKLVSILWLQQSLKAKIPESWKITFNPLWVPDEAAIATANLNNKQADAAEVTMLTGLMGDGIMAPEEVRQIVIDKYPEYDFPTDVPAVDSNVNYAEGVDNTMMDVPQDPNEPTTPPGGRNNSQAV